MSSRQRNAVPQAKLHELRTYILTQHLDAVASPSLQESLDPLCSVDAFLVMCQRFHICPSRALLSVDRGQSLSCKDADHFGENSEAAAVNYFLELTAQEGGVHGKPGHVATAFPLDVETCIALVCTMASYMQRPPPLGVEAVEMLRGLFDSCVVPVSDSSTRSSSTKAPRVPWSSLSAALTAFCADARHSQTTTHRCGDVAHLHNVDSTNRQEAAKPIAAALTRALALPTSRRSSANFPAKPVRDGALVSFEEFLDHLRSVFAAPECSDDEDESWSFARNRGGGDLSNGSPTGSPVTSMAARSFASESPNGDDDLLGLRRGTAAGQPVRAAVLENLAVFEVVETSDEPFPPGGALFEERSKRERSTSCFTVDDTLDIPSSAGGLQSGDAAPLLHVIPVGDLAAATPRTPLLTGQQLPALDSPKHGNSSATSFGTPLKPFAAAGAASAFSGSVNATPAIGGSLLISSNMQESLLGSSARQARGKGGASGGRVKHGKSIVGTLSPVDELAERVARTASRLSVVRSATNQKFQRCAAFVKEGLMVMDTTGVARPPALSLLEDRSRSLTLGRAPSMTERESAKVRKMLEDYNVDHAMEQLEGNRRQRLQALQRGAKELKQRRVREAKAKEAAETSAANSLVAQEDALVVALAMSSSSNVAKRRCSRVLQKLVETRERASALSGCSGSLAASLSPSAAMESSHRGSTRCSSNSSTETRSSSASRSSSGSVGKTTSPSRNVARDLSVRQSAVLKAHRAGDASPTPARTSVNRYNSVTMTAGPPPSSHDASPCAERKQRHLAETGSYELFVASHGMGSFHCAVHEVYSMADLLEALNDHIVPLLGGRHRSMSPLPVPKPMATSKQRENTRLGGDTVLQRRASETLRKTCGQNPVEVVDVFVDCSNGAERKTYVPLTSITELPRVAHIKVFTR